MFLPVGSLVEGLPRPEQLTALPAHYTPSHTVCQYAALLKALRIFGQDTATT